MAGNFHVPVLRPEDVIPHLGKGILHWRTGRSAAELARAWWVAGGFPENVRTALKESAEWRDAVLLEGFFERKTSLGTQGSPTQTDLLILTRSQTDYGIIAVEGKADETFGSTVDEFLNNDSRKRRLESLCGILELDSEKVAHLRYQLIHRTAAALLEADRFKCSRALVLIHHFTVNSDQETRNLQDFKDFTKTVGAPVEKLNSLSAAVSRHGIQLQFAWIDENPEPTGVLSTRDLVFALGMYRLSMELDDDESRYWQKRFILLGEAFQLPLGWQEDNENTPPIIASLAEEACKIDFFGQFIEYTPLAGEKKVHDRHMPNIKTSEYYLRERLIDYADDLLLTFWPNVKGKRVREEQLLARGLPSHPPEPVI